VGDRTPAPAAASRRCSSTLRLNASSV
jgi:hypothetical protein